MCTAGDERDGLSPEQKIVRVLRMQADRWLRFRRCAASPIQGAEKNDECRRVDFPHDSILSHHKGCNPEPA
jgi:hypothetical protein